MSLHFNQIDIEEPVENIFMEETRIEVAFNLENSVPIVLPTNIYKCNYESNRMLIYQTHPKVLPSYKYRSMHIATLVEKGLNRMMRIGLKCRIVKFLDNYKISDKITENFFLIEYFPTMRKVNLRTTYRLRISSHFNVEGKLYFEDATFRSGKHFAVQDVSVTGAGLLAPKIIGKKENPVLKIPLKKSMSMEFTLTQANTQKKPLKITTHVEIARKVMSYNVASGFLGTRFSNLNAEDQENLFQFIHKAQLYEIRNVKRYVDR
jgi:hypothetical protein